MGLEILRMYQVERGSIGYWDEWLLLGAGNKMDEIEHKETTEEFLFYQSVVNGDMEAVKRNCEQERFLDDEGVGVLSRNPITNLKYHFVVTAAMLTRLCQSRGMEMEQAFQMSDFYIQKLDDIHTVKEIRDLHDKMVLDYTKRMRKICEKDTGSKYIKACKDYIFSHIKEHITIEEVAKNLLRYSDYPVADIASHLSFSSQSHFIQRFRGLVGMTPKKFRALNQVFQWKVEK